MKNKAVAVPTLGVSVSLPQPLDAAEVLKGYLRPARELHAVRHLIGANHNLAYLPRPEVISNPSAFSSEPSVRRDFGPTFIADLRAIVAELPSESELARLSETFLVETRKTVEDPVARGLVGLMLDALRARPNDGTPTYISIAVDLVRDPVDELGEPHHRPVSAAVLAWAIRDVLRTMRFPPAPCELLEKCRDRRERFRSAAIAMGATSAWRREAEALVQIADAREAAEAPSG